MIKMCIRDRVEGKIAYRRAIKMAIANTMRMGAEGIKVLISWRLNGAETVSYTHLTGQREFENIIVGSKEEYDRILANRKNVLDYSEAE